MSKENSEPTTSVDRVVHTPGPWIYDSGCFYAECQMSSDGMTCEAPIAEMLEGRPEDSRGNAKLISLAPEMLAGIKEMLDAIEYAGTQLVGREYEAKEQLREILSRLGV